jgi:aminoglycoside 6'-N-acetyltransferase I
VTITRERFAEWKSLRQALYSGIDEAFHEAEMEAIIASGETFAFFAVSPPDTVLGLIELSLRNLVDGCLGGPVGYIEGIYLKPAARGQGFGRQMIEFAESWSRAHGCRHLATDAELATAAQEFFRRAGFEETWRIVEFRMVLVEQSARM